MNNKNIIVSIFAGLLTFSCTKDIGSVVVDVQEANYEERVCEEIMVDSTKVNPILYNKLDEAFKYLSIYQGEK